MSGPKSAQMVLQNPTVDTAVFEVARGGILREGLGYDRNDVAVVTNVTGDHLGLGGIDSIGQLANVKGVVVEAVPRSGTAVLNADDSHVYRMGRHCAGRVVLFSMATQKGEDGFDRVDGHTVARRGGVPPRAVGRGRAHRPRARVADDAGPVHPPDPGHVRWTGADERGQRAGGRRGGVGRRRPPARHPPGPADVLDVVLPGAGPAQPARGRRRPGRDRLLPQRRRDAPAGRLRRPDDGRYADQGRATRIVRRAASARAGRSASSGSRATAATTTSANTARSQRPSSTRSSSARTRTCAAAQPGETASNVIEGVRERARRRDARGRPGRQGPRGDDRGPHGAAPGDPGDLVVCCVDDAVAVYREAMAAAGANKSGMAFADPGRARGTGGVGRRGGRRRDGRRARARPAERA